MSEKPVLFSGEMVRALLAGRKTQTRRAVKPQPKVRDDLSGSWRGHLFLETSFGNFAPWPECASPDFNGGLSVLNCPYGVPGDRLWVRETWGIGGARLVDPCLNFRADGSQSPLFSVKPGWWRRAQDAFGVVQSAALLKVNDGWRPSIFMPRWASRITLEVTGVRVERVQAISEADAEAEGITDAEALIGMVKNPYVTAYADLWDKINGKRPGCAWADNPWVWVIEFKRRQ